MPIFNRYPRFLRLIRLGFYLSMPTGLLVLTLSSITDFSIHQAIALWAVAIATIILMIKPIINGLALLPHFTEELGSETQIES